MITCSHHPERAAVGLLVIVDPEEIAAALALDPDRPQAFTPLPACDECAKIRGHAWEARDGSPDQRHRGWAGGVLWLQP